MTKKILISTCFLGKECRYDGRHSKLENSSNSVIEWIPVCPEELGELGTPRPPAEIQEDGRIVTKNGDDVTNKFINGANKAIKLEIEMTIKQQYLNLKALFAERGKFMMVHFLKS